VIPHLDKKLSVEEKINEANFFKKKIEENIKTEPDVTYYFSAFLSATKSIPDFLLSDFAEKYNLNISLKIQDLRKEFIKKARKKSNREAIKFFKYFVKKYAIIRKDQICSLLFDNRNVNIHRKTISPSAATYTTLGPVNGKMAYMRIETKNQEVSKKIKNELTKFLQDAPPQIKSSFNTDVIWVLKNTNFELIKSCNHHFSLLKQFVLEAQKEFEK